MPSEDLTQLAALGSQGIVDVMARPTWPPIRDSALSLFRGSDPQEYAFIEYQLDRDAAALQAAAADARDELSAALAVVWRRQLIQLLTQRPAAEDDVRGLIGQIRAALPQGQDRHSHKQTNIARGHGTVFAVQDGNLHYHPLGQPPAQTDGDKNSDADGVTQP
jgi:hypothetical protein